MATPKLALIPTGYKAGKLYSVLPESGVGDFTVVRATEATRVNEEGLIETMGANVPRLDYSGGGCPVLLTEGQSTNLISYSEDFSNAYWNKSGSSVVSGFVSPSGDTSAFKLVEDTSTGTHYLLKNIGIADGSTNTVSLYAKKGERTHLTIYNGNVFTESSTFNLENGTSINNGTSTSKIELISNGWYKCSVTSINKARAVYAMVNNGSSGTSGVVYTGDGTSGVYIFGTMLEAGSYPTSYIKTEGSAVTRNGDQVFGAGDAATFNDSEGVLMVEGNSLVNSGVNSSVTISDTSNSLRDSIDLDYRTEDGRLRFIVYSASTVQVNISLYGIDKTNVNKIALTYKENDFQFWFNGIKLGQSQSGSVPTKLSKLKFDTAFNGSPFYGKTSQIQYFDSALTDSELEKLTSWTSFIEMAQSQLYSVY
jgi:hypothetical protein